MPGVPRYGAAHRRRRGDELARIRANPGGVPCARCGHGLWPDDAIHLDHDDHNPARYLGPAHADCNLRAGSALGHTRRWGTPHQRTRRRPRRGCPHCGDHHGPGPCPPQW